MTIKGVVFIVEWANHQYYAYHEGIEIARGNNDRNLAKKLRRKIAYWHWWESKQLLLFNEKAVE